MRKLTLRKVNAFTVDGVATTGNPAAVCLLDSSLLKYMTDSLRQAIATTINLSETAFLEPVVAGTQPDEDVFHTQDTFKLRWFTPAREVPLCGHATLASAATLFTACSNPSTALHFQTLSGTLTVTRKQNDAQELLQMSLPLSAAVDPLPSELLPPSTHDNNSSSRDSEAALPELLANSPSLCKLLRACLRTAPGELTVANTTSSTSPPAEQLSHMVQHVGYVSALQYLLVVLKPTLQQSGRQMVEALQPDRAELEAAASGDSLIGVIVTAQGAAEEGGYDFYSRFFGPWAGILEDPVTGSAHAVLAPYWSQVLGRQQLFARQCSKRGGNVWMDLAAEAGRVIVSGEAVIQETWTKTIG